MRTHHSITRLLTPQEFLLFEKQSPLKHEYVAGEIFAMTGASTRHNLIALNVVSLLRAAARARGCRTYSGDVKLRASADRIYYPDVMIVCGRAAEVDCVVECPSIVVEVTSPGTRATDRREKLEAYRCIASLRLYLIVEQRYRQVLAYSRAPDGQWVREEFSIGQDVPIRALDTTVAVDAIYDDVPMPPLRLGEKEIEWWEEPAATP